MINLESILNAGLEFGSDFVEIFREQTRRSRLVYQDQEVDSVSASLDFGYGIRMIFGENVLYVHSSYDDADKLIYLMKELVDAHQIKPDSKTKLIGKQLSSLNTAHPIAVKPSSFQQKEKLNYLIKADKFARGHSSKVNQVTAGYSDEESDVLIYNSEGLYVEDQRIRSRFNINVTAAEKENLFSGSESPGALRGGEFLKDLDIEFYTKQAADRAVLMLNADYIKGGMQPVVMGSGFGGVIFHEACGHPLETESIRKNASPFVGKVGEKIASDCVTAIDDGTIGNSWGSINVDDEGMPSQKTVLIENGVLKTYMSDRIGAKQCGVARTGSARRQSFRYAPVSRMRNTYIDAGKDSVESMIKSVDNGLYAKIMGGGSVNPSTGEFNFAVQEGYRIENGEIKEPVRGASLIGKGHEIMPQISMVGSDLALAAGMCGASSGSVPVTVGQPTIKVDEILVGGKS